MRAARLLCLPPLLALAACQTLYPTPKVEFSTATAPALPEGGPPAIAGAGAGGAAAGGPRRR